MTEARGIRLRGEHGISRKTIAQGMPGCSDCTCMLVCASTTISCTRDRGCSKHPAFPAPSSLGETVLQSPGETRRGNAEVCLCVGWVERSETHRPGDWQAVMGIASLHPSYGLLTMAAQTHPR